MPVRAHEPSERVELAHDTAASLFITGTNLYLILLLQLPLNFAPKECTWCAAPDFDESARDALLWQDPKTAGWLSDIGSYVVEPAAAVSLTALAAEADGRGDETGTNLVILSEAASSSLLVSQFTKMVAGRERPAVHHHVEREQDFPRRELNTSFYSGHTSTSFTLAVSAGTIASMRGYRLAPLVWAAGLPIAAFVGYARVADDSHWASDVIVGAVIGASMGFLLPYCFHPPIERGAAASPRTAFRWHPMLMSVERGLGAGIGGTF